MLREHRVYALALNPDADNLVLRKKSCAKPLRRCRVAERQPKRVNTPVLMTQDPTRNVLRHARFEFTDLLRAQHVKGESGYGLHTLDKTMSRGQILFAIDDVKDLRASMEFDVAIKFFNETLEEIRTCQAELRIDFRRLRGHVDERERRPRRVAANKATINDDRVDARFREMIRDRRSTHSGTDYDNFGTGELHRYALPSSTS